jgi:STE24 endopeptidase
MHALIISAFVVLFLREPLLRGEMPPLLQDLGPASAALLSLGLMALVWAGAHLAILLQVRRMDRGRPDTVAWADRILLGSRLVALAVHGVNILLLGWLDIIRGQLGDIILLDEFLAVLPLVMVLLGGWWSMYPVERRIREVMILRDLDMGRPVRPIPGRLAHMVSVTRHQAAIVLVPILIILSWSECIQFAASRRMLPAWMPVEGLQFAGAVLALTLMPLVLRRVWDTIHLEAGPLRDDLIAMCREHRVRIRDVLLWRTHGVMINGAVMGLVGPARYVMLTDALLEMLPAQQIRAVMAHELGHIRRWHMPWLAGAALSSIVLASASVSLATWLIAPAWWHSSTAESFTLAAGLAAGLIVFGFVSRRFEWQADAFAVQHLSGWRGRPEHRGMPITPEAVRAMADALDAVATLNHIPRHRFTWRHGSIASRQRRLLALVGRPAGRLRPDRDAAIIKALVAGALAAVGALLVLERIL